MLSKFLQSDLGEIIKAIGIIATAIISIWSLRVNYKTLRKATYINQITSLKAKNIESLRQHISEFCSISYECSKATFNAGYTAEKNTNPLIKEMEQKYYLVILFLNNENKIHEKVRDLLDQINLEARSLGVHGMTISHRIDKLLNYVQKVLHFEWQNLEREAKNGPISQDKIDQARSLFWEKYENL